MLNCIFINILIPSLKWQRIKEVKKNPMQAYSKT